MGELKFFYCLIKLCVGTSTGIEKGVCIKTHHSNKDSVKTHANHLNPAEIDSRREMSSHNILQLMTHLNDFEITINNVICEFATRLSALIDANFFLILENRDGRKLCGSTGLVDQYVRGTLRPLDTDQIATFDPKVTGNHFVHLATATSNTDVGDDVEGRGSHGGVVGGSGGA